MKVLIVTYEFPPAGGVATYRVLRYIRHLHKYGWQPLVLTIDAPSERYDAELVSLIPPDVVIYRTPTPSLPKSRWMRIIRSLLSVPDVEVSWRRLAVPAALEILQKWGCDAIYTTSAPYTAHLIGLDLKRATGLPWIADFQDEWTQNPSLRVLPWNRERHKRMEQDVLQAADAVVSVSETLTRGLASFLPAQAGKFHVITNGYDPEDFLGELPSKVKDHFTITYTGNFYGLRRPTIFLEAVNNTRRSGLIPPHQIRIQFFGRIKAGDIRRVDLENVLQVHDYVPHAEAIKQQRSADVLLLVVRSVQGTGVLTGKLFEYMATGNPILALVPPDGEAARLIRESNTGFVVDPDDAHAIEAAIVELYQKWKTGSLKINPNWDVIEQYNAVALTGKLAELLDKVASK